VTSTERPEQAEALRRAISLDRLGTYNQAADATGADVLDLYIWDRDLSAAFLADIAIIEVALRNAMHTALSNSYGEDWYTRPEVGLDDRSEASIAVAWRRLHERRQPQTSGRVVAQLMLGFWVGLLDSGGERGKPPRRINCDYEVLWREALHHAFPGGRTEANTEDAQFTRTWTSHTVAVVHALRNRVSHHEPLVRDFPLPGQKDRHGHPLRVSAADGHAACLKVTRLLDRNLAAWLTANTTVPAILDRRP
jgi:hypothetical protein